MKWYEWYLKVVKNYAVFSGRARRKEYWMFVLCNFLISLVLTILDGALGCKLPVGTTEIGILNGIYGLALFIPGLAVAVRRLHDIGKSGWWYLINLIPAVGNIIFIVWTCFEGEPKANQYGEDPKAEEHMQEA
ncbi:MAG: DUF805 domain-containing protein [Paludibacteraceae bacterium]|nr:DUF805 domain-containing protein [Paludibacteraceae bacterium]